jgi:hypothetical protein
LKSLFVSSDLRFICIRKHSLIVIPLSFRQKQDMNTYLTFEPSNISLLNYKNGSFMSKCYIKKYITKTRNVSKDNCINHMQLLVCFCFFNDMWYFELKTNTNKIPLCRNRSIFYEKITGRGKIYTPKTQVHDRLLSYLGTGTIIKSGGFKLALFA